MPALSLNSHNLPYPDPIHPIIVHFLIAMVFFSFFCDVVGYLTGKHSLFEVSAWNMLVAAIAIFLAVIFGQIEAALALPYAAVKPVLNLHTITGWSLSVLVAAIATWRLVIRTQNPLKIPVAYLGVAMFLICLVSFQTYLGTRLVWEYGLHVEPIVEAVKKGLLR
ncbi:MAG TPA: DUF2231 domain-containing protein [Nostocaceae cyanobacterium]|nr:DUF2231 domain-containing protein [Nostocaceae cyanobacterium]